MERMAAAWADGQTFLNGTEEDFAFRDPLTGLPNAHYFAATISQMATSCASNRASFAVVILDFDGFKPISDLFGRRSGDRILQQAAARLREAAPARCTVARVGGDEFGVLFPYALNDCDADKATRALIDIISRPYDVGRRTACLTASAGCSLFQSYRDTTELMLSKAETALYQAKRSGRGQISIYSLKMERNAKQLTRIEQALRRAIAAKEVEPYFQPIVDLASRRILGFEAVARWTDYEMGQIPPAIFIPIAEEGGFVGELSDCVLRKAAVAANHWPESCYLSFNLSPSQLVDQNTARQIDEILKQTRLQPARLEIELTESGLMTDPVSAAKIIDELRDGGMRVALDDFGVGQSSLSRLRDFAFDKLKIDQGFIASMLKDRPSEHIIRAILAMCNGLGIDVVAEGIEEEAQVTRLLDLGCATGQGFLFGKPRDARTTISLLQESIV